MKHEDEFLASASRGERQAAAVSLARAVVNGLAARVGIEASPDVHQEAALAALEAVETWDSLLDGFRRHVGRAVLRGVQSHLRAERGAGMRADNRARPVMVSTDAPAHPEGEEVGGSATVGDYLTYGGAIGPDGRPEDESRIPAGFGDPAAELEARQFRLAARRAVRSVRDERVRDLLQTLGGIDRVPMTVDQWADTYGVHRATAYRLMDAGLAAIRGILGAHPRQRKEDE